ncbi:hypothetical protein GEMRC1_011464 [Eukaryota sp. GEM-RC1]
MDIVNEDLSMTSPFFCPLPIFEYIFSDMSLERTFSGILSPHGYDREVLETLSKQFPTMESALTEAVNLNAILNLPTPSCQFLSDLHGAYESVEHVIRSASGNLRRKIEQCFTFHITTQQKNELSTLICYPNEKLPLMLRQHVKSALDENDFYLSTLYRLVQLCRRVSAKYTRSKVTKALPSQFSYVINELLSPQEEEESKKDYYKEILQGIIDIGAAADLVKALCHSIQRLIINKVYVLGDIYDRGNYAERCVDLLMSLDSVEFIWGNHDALWMGGALGSDVCIASILRISVRYDNLHTLEAGYGISLTPLIRFVDLVYKDDPAERFKPNKEIEDPGEAVQLARMQKAMAIIQFKLEKKYTERRPYWNFDCRNFLHRIRQGDDGKLFVTLEDDQEYEMLDNYFPTIDFDSQNPYELTDGEVNLVKHFRESFLDSQTLQKHVNFLINNGGLYKIHDDKLLLHAGIPVDQNGDVVSVQVDEHRSLKGKELFDYLDRKTREAFYFVDSFSIASDVTGILPATTRERSYTAVEEIRKQGQSSSRDLLFWLWSHPESPLFQRTAMKTFESYFVADKEAKKEQNAEFFSLRESKEMVMKWLKEFGVEGEDAKIIQGHTPVKMPKGEVPVKADGHLLVIDGGFSSAYWKTTGISGFTLVESSHGLFCQVIVLLLGGRPVLMILL